MGADTVTDRSNNWEAAVTARSLAFLCLLQSEAAKKGTLEQAKFLMTLGLPRAEAAALIGSSDDSIRVMLGREGKKAPAKPSGEDEG